VSEIKTWEFYIVAFMKFISVSEALNLMADTDRDGNRLPFGLRWLTCSRSRGTGGKWKQEEALELLPISDDMKGKGMVNVRKWGSRDLPTAVHFRLIFGIKPHGASQYIDVA